VGRALKKSLEQTVELIERGIVDYDLAFALLVHDFTARAEMAIEP
jgi:hypothetical protein